MSKNSALHIDSLSVSYGRSLILDSVSLSIKRGELFGLIGLNGQGKTTLIKTILDLTRPDEGTVSIFDQPHFDPQSRNVVSYLPERFDPAWFLTGWEFLAFVFKLHNKVMQRENVLPYIQKLSLPEEAMKRPVRTYSKGMRQKLGIVGAVLVDSDLVILDEPMSGLDPLSRVAVKDILQEMKAQKKTIFFSSHILSDMEEICDRVAVLHDRKIQFTGAPSALTKKMKSKTLEAATLQLIEGQQAA